MYLITDAEPGSETFVFLTKNGTMENVQKKYNLKCN
jgi:hypothetical protein